MGLYEGAKVGVYEGGEVGEYEGKWVGLVGREVGCVEGRREGRLRDRGCK